MDQVKNFAKVTVDGTVEQSATSITLVTGDGAKLPPTPFNAVLWNATDYPDPADYPEVEVVRVTAISTDTLTVTRAQEGTGDQDHALGGKVYKLLAGLTALAWSTLLGDVFGSGTAVLIDPSAETIELRQSATRGMFIDGSSTSIEDTASVSIGDPIGNGNSSFVHVSDANQRFGLFGMDLATDRTASATGPAITIVAKLLIKDVSGTNIGYIPIYSSIT